MNLSQPREALVGLATRDDEMREILAKAVAFGTEVALVASCSVAVEGAPKVRASWGELKVGKAVDSYDRPFLNSKKRVHLAAGERVLGMCVAYTSEHAETSGTGFMQVEVAELKTYLPTHDGPGGRDDVFTIPEDKLSERYPRCDDPRLL